SNLAQLAASGLRRCLGGLGHLARARGRGVAEQFLDGVTLGLGQLGQLCPDLGDRPALGAEGLLLLGGTDQGAQLACRQAGQVNAH
ncbi:hypothetical protein, partial [Enterobacter hormaechei]|uniref:hypothetical protein n=1 Tax=Enterobacter hormaechei TaxID=158836 RepID=UPI001954B916